MGTTGTTSTTSTRGKKAAGERFALEVSYPTRLYLTAGPYSADAFFVAAATASRERDLRRFVQSSGADRRKRDIEIPFATRREAAKAAARVLDLGVRGVRATVVVHPDDAPGITYRIRVLSTQKAAK